ncbi:unnamed protein product [Brachionus calyciflorus]|uniref:Uncharacterized protein n=1 Tax=Brachionus calyciflorus TaxID=104777 RepID=A0A814MAZ0_9BILA|nr:unnamed protein product [Brachionus calyciflorus]
MPSQKANELIEDDINSDNQVIDAQAVNEQQTTDDKTSDDKINDESEINGQNINFDQGSEHGDDQDNTIVGSDSSQNDEIKDPTHKEKILKEIFAPDRPVRNRKQPDWYGRK